MNTALIFLVALPAFYWGYKVYSSYIASVFEEDDSKETPAVEINDGVDYVPTKPWLVFSHHFSSIAASGPIVGPTLALIYGVTPVWLWIVIGNVFAGAVHDFTAMFTSIREKGKSIAEVSERAVGKAAFLLFISFAIIALILVCAVFLRLTAAALTSFVPLEVLGLSADQNLVKTVVVDGVEKARMGGVASTSVIIITFFAPFFGYALYKKNVQPVAIALAAFLVSFFSVWVGMKAPITIDPTYWMFIISFYTLIAASIPVWIVLQPRDFINSFFLFIGVAAMVVGGIAAGAQGVTFSAPSWNLEGGTEKLGVIWPMLFITVACGACSGFHALVASGTSCKQINKERYVRKIGYGGMLLEGLMALGVLIAVGAGLSFADYSSIVHPDAGLKANPVLGFSLGLGGLLEKAFGLSTVYGTIFGILLLEGFMVTTLDTAIRLTRYLLEELWPALFGQVPAFMKSYLFNSGLCVGLMLFLGYYNAIAAIWPIFGSANQMLASLTLITVTAWLAKKGKNYYFTLVPALFMIVTTFYSLIYLLFKKYLPAGNLSMITATLILMGLALGVIVLSVKMIVGRGREESLEAL